MKTQHKLKQYVFNFRTGGWNTEWAKNKRSAIAQAKKKWNELDVDYNSFRIAKEEEIKWLMSTFY